MSGRGQRSRAKVASRAKLLRTSQPYVAKLESGKIKNLEVKTLVQVATALGGRLTLKIEPARRRATRAVR